MDSLNKRTALKFIVLMGVISLFADMTYEGARSIIGPYFAILGASAAVVGFVSGLGELVGYSLRLVSGYLTDRTGKYWLITILGYSINLIAVPLLGLTHHWPMAAALIIAERFGKAIRVPARDAMLSYAGNTVGMGWGFGLHKALDQVGAMLGPLVIAGVLFVNGSYRHGFGILAIPALLALVILILTQHLYPHPKDLAAKYQAIKTKDFALPYWLYVIAACFVAAGYADYSLIAYHFQKVAVLSASAIPIAYAFSMGLNGLISPLLGRFYDRRGFVVLIVVTLLSAFFAPLVFLGNSVVAFAGVALWSIGMAAQDSLMRAIVGNMISVEKRGSAYGIFNMAYGVSWFLGSAMLGFIYDKSIFTVVIFIMVLQFLSIPWLVMAGFRMRNSG